MAGVEKKSGRALLFPEIKEILEKRSIPAVRGAFVNDLSGALKGAEGIGYPVVLKVVSRDVTHKTDVGGVALDLKSPEDLKSAWKGMLAAVRDKAPGADISGFSIEKMVHPGLEVIVGALRDSQFGPVVMFGIGGIAVEIMKDVSFRLAPVTKKEALEMLKEVRLYPLLAGFRGSNPKDIDALSDVVMKFSEIIDEEKELEEIEINPLIVYEKGVVAVDSRAILL
ncbi:MAG TPA: acetate--CoA ligase family protein [Thermodesulfobacteriota bacterium]|nr:acetate--CoA ligase family protein [Thermodesulfobacteriota bacterium]